MTTARDSVAEAAAVATAVAPMLPPNIALALLVAARLTNLVLEASASGADVTDAMLDRAIGDYALARAENAEVAQMISTAIKES